MCLVCGCTGKTGCAILEVEESVDGASIFDWCGFESWLGFSDIRMLWLCVGRVKETFGG